jgi:prepilin-type N-terminal cleavage/methylation domain-containing protein
MKPAGYSLIEVMVAAAVVAVGLTASAVLVGTLMQQEELNAAALRAANLQEQAVTLYRLDVAEAEINALLPKVDGYTVSFASLSSEDFEVDGTTVWVDVSECAITYPDPSGGGDTLSNNVTVVRPSIRAGGN